ncbi:MAG: hypothetical protein PHS46_07830 [Candidatus Omnitrophica bacterium]|nr:hypothetical protein [Candidatus Omnitrophota bacterium]
MYKFFQSLPISALWIAFVETFWILILSDLCGVPVPYAAFPVVFLLVFAIYAKDHAGGGAEDDINNPGRIIRYPIEKIAYIVGALALIIVVATDYTKLPFVVIPVIIGYSYAMKFGNFRPKDIPGLKTLIVAAPTAYCYAGLVGGDWRAYLLVFLVTIIDTTLCDIRDAVGDVASGVRTVPVLLGRSRTLAILAIVDIAIFYLSPIVGILGMMFIIYFRKVRPNSHYDVLVDGWILWVFLFSEILK